MNNFGQKYGPWALITGASSGIGAEFASQLAAAGLNLLLVARRRERLETLAGELERRHGIQVKTIALDLTRPDFIGRIQAVAEELEVGLLINNAGAHLPGTFLSHSLDEELEILNLCCRTPLILTHEFGRKMAQRRRGGIIFMASMMAYQGVPHMAHYAATKSYNLVLAEGLRHELAIHQVDVLAVSPGFTDTELLMDMDFSGIPLKPMRAERVVDASLRALGRRPVVVPGRLNMFLNFMGKYLTPRFLNTAIFAQLVRRVLRT